MTIVPPGSGIVHQVNLEYLGRVVFNMDNMVYPDSVVGTDSHTTMINGLGIVGWGKYIVIYNYVSVAMTMVTRMATMTTTLPMIKMMMIT